MVQWFRVQKCSTHLNCNWHSNGNYLEDCWNSNENYLEGHWNSSNSMKCVRQIRYQPMKRCGATTMLNTDKRSKLSHSNYQSSICPVMAPLSYMEVTQRALITLEISHGVHLSQEDDTYTATLYLPRHEGFVGDSKCCRDCAVNNV